MPNFWEPKRPGHWAHGFLICGATQDTGYEFHGSFPRDGRLPHISVYEIGATNRKIRPSIYLRQANGTVGLTASDRTRFSSEFGVSDDARDAFVRDIWAKHRALNPPAAKPKKTSHYVGPASAFPPLPGAAATPPGVPVPYPNTAPPLLSDRPLGLSPGAMAELRAMPAHMQGMLAQSGAFD
ncbi:hypothetical protein [Oceaniglobus trochenteri]|uniref:hypothetical protein n=1 Tax=Oceaniglobus trochenteri TaxID=2763260 RepID=UPI001D000884|nr:hypothetical protein [Oceaniglobus trochenteri]